MSSIREIPANQKTAYKRPYKTRGQRRETARRKHDESADRKFLIRVGLIIGILLLVVIGVALKGSREATEAAQALSGDLY